MTTEAFIYEAIRTPRGRGKQSGSLHSVKPISLVTGLIDELRTRFPDLDEDRISDLILGVVSPLGDQGMDIARIAATDAGLPDTVGGVQINRFCASGLEAVNMAAQKVRSGWDEMVIAGGVESMSRVKMGSDGGPWVNDPATNYDNYVVPQGIGADLIASIEGFSRDDVDAYAVRSQDLAAKAWAGGYFAKSVVPVKDINGITILDNDEHMRPAPRPRVLRAWRRRSRWSATWAASTPSRCRSTTGSRRSTTSTTAATAPASSTVPRCCSSAARTPARRWV